MAEPNSGSSTIRRRGAAPAVGFLEAVLPFAVLFNQPPLYFLTGGAVSAFAGSDGSCDSVGFNNLGVLVISETGFNFPSSESSPPYMLRVAVVVLGLAVDVARSVVGAGAIFRVATAAAAALASSLSKVAALFLRDRLGVKPVRGRGPSRRTFLSLPGVVLSTGMAGNCASGLGSKSSGRRRLRLELV